MEDTNLIAFLPARKRPWNKGRLTGQKPPLLPKHVWAIRTRLQLANKTRDLALFNLAIDSKLRGCEVVRLLAEEIAPNGVCVDRATIRQRKTGRPVRFEITEQTRQSVLEHLKTRRRQQSPWELTIRPEAGDALLFVPGQFVWLNVGSSPFSLAENPFSISSAPADRNQLQFVIKEVGDMTRSLPEVKPGTMSYLDGPYGNLTLQHRHAAGIALIAGGVGIAPLLSIARQLKADQDPRPLVMVYGNRVAEQIVYADELEELTAHPGSQLVHVVSEPRPDWRGLTGVIDAGTLGRVFGSRDVSGWLFLVCGPPVMLDVVEAALRDLGVPARQIVSERFHYD